MVDPNHDLATLRIGPVAAGSALKLKAEMPSVGEKVAAFGNPQGFSFTTSEGIVSAIRRGKEVHDTIGQAYKDLGFTVDATWIQTTAAISGGNSGGPLVTMNSEVVGLNTWGDDSGQQLNFAISLIDIKRYLDQVKPGLPVARFRYVAQSQECGGRHLAWPTATLPAGIPHGPRVCLRSL